MDIPRLITFRAGPSGPWQITSQNTVIGSVDLDRADRLDVETGESAAPPPGGWTLRGVTSNVRYVERPEKQALADRQEGLGRPSSTRAALIPIRKSEAWWELTQEERRAIFEQQSAHITTGLRYLPAIARRLHHSRDLGEPFDFLTWFEYAPADAGAFEELVGLLRETEEWRYVDAEVDLRLERAATA